MTFSFTFADKQNLSPILPQLFRILYANMSVIAPTGDTYEEDLAMWSQNILPAMQEKTRQLVLMSCNGEPAGYFQYAIHPDLLMMEEIEIKKEYQGSGLFQELYRWLKTQLPAGLTHVEAYAHKSNLKSQGILEHLGLNKTGENPSGSSWHYRGLCRDLWENIQ